MRQEYEIRNTVDEEGNPAGGWVRKNFNTLGKGIHIEWQEGPLREPDGFLHKPNGAFVEDVLEIAQTRLEFYQNSKFACVENAYAIEYIQKARDMLADRIRRREEANTFGTHEGN